MQQQIQMNRPAASVLEEGATFFTRRRARVSGRNERGFQFNLEGASGRVTATPASGGSCTVLVEAEGLGVLAIADTFVRDLRKQARGADRQTGGPPGRIQLGDLRRKLGMPEPPPPPRPRTAPAPQAAAADAPALAPALVVPIVLESTPAEPAVAGSDPEPVGQAADPSEPAVVDPAPEAAEASPAALAEASAALVVEEAHSAAPDEINVAVVTEEAASTEPASGAATSEPDSASTSEEPAGSATDSDTPVPTPALE